MEQLPLLAMEALCQYLSAADMTACSAVSRGWRAVFNEDSLWRPYCEPDLEEVLRTTPPTVRQDSTVQEFDIQELRRWLQTDICTESSSTNTETVVTVLEESTSLEPLCQWRQAHIRQNCLIYNWKHVRFSRSKVTLDCKDESCYHKAKFITDDYIFVTCESTAEITIWNVNSNPPVKCTGTSYRHLSDVRDDWQTYVDQSRTQGYLVCFKQNKVISAYEKDFAIHSVDIYHFDLNAITLELCYIFTSKKFMRDCEGAANPSDIIVFEKLIQTWCVVEHTFLVAFAETPDASEIHIWDLQTGEKIKTVPLPPNEYLYAFKVAGKDVLVVTVYYKDDKDRVVYFYKGPKAVGYRYHIYNVKLLTFLSFTVGRELMAGEYPYDDDSFGMVENYLIIKSVSSPYRYTFQIYNYQTNKLIHQGPRLTFFDFFYVYFRALTDGFFYFYTGSHHPHMSFVLFDPRDETELTLADSDRDLLKNIFAMQSTNKIFIFKHVLFSNVTKKTIKDLYEVTETFHMNPSLHVGVYAGFRNKILSIIRFW